MYFQSKLKIAYNHKTLFQFQFEYEKYTLGGSDKMIAVLPVTLKVPSSKLM